MTKPKGFAKPKPVIQERRIWLELKRYFPNGKEEIDLGWIEFKLKVIDAPKKLYAADWIRLQMRVMATWIDSYRYPANAAADELSAEETDKSLVPNHGFVYDAVRDEVLAQLGLHEFDTRDDKVDKIQVNSRARV